MSREAGPRKQHVVSKVLLKQFVRDGRLRELVVARPGSQWRWSTPAASGYVPSFVRVDAASVEARWKDVEDRVPDALAVIHAGGAVPPGSPTEATITALLALHWARSKAVRDEADRIYLDVRAASQARLADHPDVLDRIHYGRTGLVAAGPETRQEVNDRLHQTEIRR